MPIVVTQTSNSAELAADLRQVPLRFRAAIPGVVDKSAADFLAAVKRNASGRPGPNAPTGDYRASWLADPPEETANTYSVTAGTNRPQARRLEYGFVGADSLGRVYNQPPYPHVDPAFLTVQPQFEAAVGALLAGL